MKRTRTLLSLLLTLIAALCTAPYAQAQVPTIANGGFETWTNAGGVELPTGWNTSEEWNMGCSPATAVKSTDKSDGTYALKLETSFCAQIGSAHEGSASAWVAVSTRPDSLKFKYKATFSGADTARVTVDLLSGTTIVGRGVYYIRNTQSTYKQVSVPISKISNTAPVNAYIYIASDGFMSPTIGNKLWVDDLKFAKTIPASVQTQAGIVSEVTSYPSPVAGTLHLSFRLAQPSQLNFRLYDMKGALLSETAGRFEAGTQTHSIDMSLLPRGLYLCSIQAPDGSRVTQKIVK